MTSGWLLTVELESSDLQSTSSRLDGSRFYGCCLSMVRRSGFCWPPKPRPVSTAYSSGLDCNIRNLGDVQIIWDISQACPLVIFDSAFSYGWLEGNFTENRVICPQILFRPDLIPYINHNIRRNGFQMLEIQLTIFLSLLITLFVLHSNQLAFEVKYEDVSPHRRDWYPFWTIRIINM